MAGAGAVAREGPAGRGLHAASCVRYPFHPSRRMRPPHPPPIQPPGAHNIADTWKIIGSAVLGGRGKAD